MERKLLQLRLCFLAAVFFAFSESLWSQWEPVYPKTFYSSPSSAVYIQDKNTAFIMPESAFGHYLKTDDAGLTWVEHSFSSGFGSGISCMASASKSHIWAGNLSGLLASSTDGGKTWEERFFNSPIRSISFFDKQTGWVLTGDQVLRYTHDGGKTWQKYSCSNGYIFAISPTHLLGGELGRYRHESLDGGKTWTELPALLFNYDPELQKIFLSEPCNRVNTHSSNQYHTYSIRERELYNQEGSNIINRSYSVNPENTWFNSSSGGLVFTENNQSSTLLPLKTRSVTDIGFFTEKIGLVFTNNTLYRTENAGASWQEIMPFHNRKEHFLNLVFLNKDTAFACAYTTNEKGYPQGGSIFMSSNGGDNWLKVYYDPVHTFNSLIIIDNKLHVVCGDGYILDFNFQLQNIQSVRVSSHSLTSIKRIGSDVFVSGLKGQLFHRKIFEPHWDFLDLNDTAHFTRLEIGKNDGSLFITGPHGYFYSSTDTGKNWTKVFVEDSSQLTMGIAFTSIDSGYLLVYQIEVNGSIISPATILLQTSDGGKNWTGLRVPVNNSHFGICYDLLVQDEFILAYAENGAYRKNKYSINFAQEFAYTWGGPNKLVVGPNGEIFALNSGGTILKRHTMQVFDLIEPSNGENIDLRSERIVPFTWERVKGAYNYSIQFRSGDSLCSYIYGDYLTHIPSTQTTHNFERNEIHAIIQKLNLPEDIGTLFWSVYAVNTEDSVLASQSHSLTYSNAHFYGESPITNVALYPNPASSNVTLVFDEIIPDDLIIGIFDMHGKKLRAFSIKDCQCRAKTLDIQNLSSGNYLLRVVSKSFNESLKLSITR